MINTIFKALPNYQENEILQYINDPETKSRVKFLLKGSSPQVY